MSESCVDAELDRLYWNTDLTVGDIAELVGLPATGLNRHASPLPADVRCYLCRNELAFTSRSQRSEQRVRCYACVATRAAVADVLAPTATIGRSIGATSVPAAR